MFANFGDLMGAAEPILTWHPSSLRRSLYCSYQSEAQTQLVLLPDSHCFSQIALFGILSQPAKWGWACLRDISFWRPLILFRLREMSMGWSDAARSKITSIRQNGIVLPYFPSRLERLEILFLITASSHHDLCLRSSARPRSCPSSKPLPDPGSPFPWCWWVWRALSCTWPEKPGVRDSSGRIFCAYSGVFFFNSDENPPECWAPFRRSVACSVSVEQRECRDLLCCSAAVPYSLFGCSFPMNLSLNRRAQS